MITVVLRYGQIQSLFLESLKSKCMAGLLTYSCFELPSHSQEQWQKYRRNI